MDAVDRLQSGLFTQLNTNAISRRPKNSRSRDLGLETIPSTKDSSACLPEFLSSHPAHLQSHDPQMPLPLLSVSVDVDLHGRLCSTKVTQRFSNASTFAAENTKYVFPVYDGSSITSFRCWVGNDKLLEGAVKAKEAARAEFQHAVSHHKVAVLVEELAPEVFETNVGNIHGQTTVKIEITYASLLKVDNSTGGLVLTIPTSIAPRYGVAPEGYSENKPFFVEGLRVNIQASMPAAIRKMESRSHPISVEIGAVAHNSFDQFAAGASSETFDPSKGRATLADTSTVLERDFVLYILCNPQEFTKSQAFAATQPSQPNLSTLAVSIHPRDLFSQNTSTEDFDGEIIFVADRSGSMMSKIRSLINVMDISLRSLPRKCSFNIASFGSGFAWLWPVSKEYRQENLGVASQHVNSFEANYGGTKIYEALESVLLHCNQSSEVPTSVIVLTDGEVWDVENVIQLVRKTVSNHESNIRFFSIGIGDRVSHRLVEGIGLQGGGYAEIVPESTIGIWQERVIQMLKAALAPSRLQCKVDVSQELAAKTTGRQVSGCTVDFPAMIKAPHDIPVLNTFSHFQLYYMLESGLEFLPAVITVSAMTDKGESLAVQLPLQKITEQTAIHHLAAKALMNDYETGRSWLHSQHTALKSTDPTLFDRILAQQAQILGQKWSVTGKWTSYVAIDRATTQHHEVSLRKADTVEISQLTRLRPDSSGIARQSCLARQNRDQHRLEPGIVADYFRPDTSGGMCSASSHEENDKQKQSHGQAEKNATFLFDILVTQAANGEFILSEYMLRDFLGPDYESLVLEQFLSSMSENNTSVQEDPGLVFLRQNILAVVYITHRHVTSKNLWELQVEKARQWIRHKMVELWKKDSLEGLPELEALESLIIKELHEKDLQRT